MVSVNQVVNVSLENVQSKNVAHLAKKTIPAAGGLAVLAGAGMSVVDDLSSISVAPLPSGADVYSDPLMDQLSYRADQIIDAGSNLVEGVSDIAGGAAHIATTLGGAALDTVDLTMDVASAGIAKAIGTIVDIIG